MIETPWIASAPAQMIASVPLKVTREEIAKVMGPAIAELFGTLAMQGITPAGPWMTHHNQRPGATFDLQVCVPVDTPVDPDGRVIPGEHAAATVARTVYHGRYEGLSEAWGELMAWIAAEGHTPRADLWETYLTGPESVTNSADYRTELNQPLASTPIQR